jgi:hypothetical protein
MMKWDWEINVWQQMGTDVQDLICLWKPTIDNIWSDLGASCATTSSSISDISLHPQDEEEEPDEQQTDCCGFSGTPMDLELETNVSSNRALGGPVPLSWEE